LLLLVLIVKPITYLYALVIFSQLFLLNAVLYILRYGDDDYIPPTTTPYTNLNPHPIPKLPKHKVARKRRSKLSGARANTHILSIIKDGSTIV